MSALAALASLLCAAAGEPTVLLAPRSVTIGQTAAKLAPGAVEVGLGFAASFWAVTLNVVDTSGEQGSASLREIIAPQIEGHLGVGLSNWLGLDVHGSASGVQPGLKMALIQGDFALALLPAVGVYWSTRTASFQGSAVGADFGTNSGLGLLAGLKLLMSDSSGGGLYVALGYDFERFSRSSNPPSSGSFFSTRQVAAFHNVSAALGFSFIAGPLRIRPELDAVWSPISLEQVAGGASLSQQGSGWMVGPSLTVAAGG